MGMEGDDLCGVVRASGDGTDTIEGGAGASWIDAISLEGAGAPAGSGSPGTGWTLHLDGNHEITGQTEESMLLTQDSSGHIIFDDGSEIHFSGIEEVRF